MVKAASEMQRDAQDQVNAFLEKLQLHPLGKVRLTDLNSTDSKSQMLLHCTEAADSTPKHIILSH